MDRSLVGCVASWWLNQPISKICLSQWESSPHRDAHLKKMKPPPRLFCLVLCFWVGGMLYKHGMILGQILKNNSPTQGFWRVNSRGKPPISRNQTATVLMGWNFVWGPYNVTKWLGFLGGEARNDSNMIEMGQHTNSFHETLQIKTILTNPIHLSK